MGETQPLLLENVHPKAQKTNLSSESYKNKNSTFLKPNQPNWRQKNAHKLYSSKLVVIWDIFDLFLNLLLVGVYINDTKFVERDGIKQSIPVFDRQFEFCLALALLIQYFFQLFFAGKLFKFFYSLLTLVTLASTLAPIFSFLLQQLNIDSQDYTYMNAGSFVYLYPLRFLRLQLVTSQFLSQSKTSYLPETTRKGLSLGATIFLTLLTISSLVHIVSFKQTNTNDLRFIDAFFFTAVSSTSGYKTDLVPENSFTRMVILYVMILGAVFLPKNISEFLILMNKKSKYVKSYKQESQTCHVVVCGNFSVNTITEFLREFFCEDHGSQTINTNVVILNPSEPEEEIVSLLNNALYIQRVQYVKGNAYIDRYLEKAKIKQANACFILSNIGDKHMAEKKDAETVMTALSIRKYAKNLKIYAVVSLPESKQHLKFIVDHIVCIEELRLGLLAQSTINKGFFSFVFLLTTSFSSNIFKKEAKGKSEQWFRDYTQGATNEIYSTKISKYYVGLSFVDFVEIVYRYYGAIVFAVRKNENNDKSIYLNPINYTLTGKEIVFIVCDSLKTAQKIHKFDRKHFKYNETFSFQMNKIVLLDVDIQPKDKEIAHVGTSQTIIPRNVEGCEEAGTSKVVSTSIENSTEKKTPGPKQFASQEIQASNSEFINMQRETIMNVVSRLLKEEGFSHSQLVPKNLKNHIIICDPSTEFPHNLEYLVGCFRQKHLKYTPEIVILTTGIPSQSTKNYLKNLEKIYFVNGSPLLKKDLYRAGVTKAKKAVILCESRKSSTDDQMNPGIIDAPTLLITMNIESMCLNKKMFIMAEFVGRDNMKLLNKSKILNSDQNDTLMIFTPSFMSGNTFCSLSLETIICQTYYNPHLLCIMEKMVFGTRNIFENFISDLDVSGQSYIDKDIVGESNLYKSRVPPNFIGENFYKFFIWAIRVRNSVVMSIYRTETEREEPFSYVILNPSPEMTLKETDKAFILSSKPW